MSKNRVLTALLTGLLAASSLASCNSADTSSSASSSADSQPSSLSSQEDEDAKSSFAGYPMDTDQTLTVWSSIVKPHTSYADYTESPFHTGLAEMTGIDVQWEFPTAGTDASQAFSLMLASDVLPDVIIGPMMYDAQRYIDEKVILDLTDKMAEYAPNYYAYLQANPYIDKSVKTDSGLYYGFANILESSWNASFVGPVVRADWLEEQQLEIPQTVADWDNVLRTFQEAYGAQMSFALSRLNPGLAGAYGAYGTFVDWAPTYYIDDGGKVQVAQVQPEWKTYMEQLSTWYADGIIDPDSLTLDDAGVRTKALNEKVGITFTSMGNLSNWIADAESSGLSADWVGIPYPASEAGGKVCATQMNDVVATFVGTVTTSCAEDKIELAMRWLDYGYSEEGIRYWNFGKEGDTYTMVDGEPVYTAKILEDPEGISTALDKYIGTQWNSITIQAASMVKQKNSEAAVEAVDTWLSNSEMADHILPGGVTMTTEESNEVDAIQTAITTYIQEMSLKFFTGEESLDQFDAFVETLNGMGLERLLEVKQAAYDRFLAR